MRGIANIFDKKEVHGMIDINIKGAKYGNCMFYPDNSYPCYRICLKISDVIKEEVTGE